MSIATEIKASSRRMVAHHLAALTFADIAEPPPGWPGAALLLALHLLGLAAVWRYYQQPVWLALPTFACFCILPLWLGRSHSLKYLATLAPLFFLYAILGLRFVFVRGFNGGVPGYFDYLFPDPTVVFFRIEPWTVCAVLYTLVVQLKYVVGSVRRVAVGCAIALVLVALGWATAVYVGQRTSGVTASDPFAYAQMAVDLVERGTPLHRFALFPSIVPLGISWSPIVHTGYHIPIDLAGDAPTVWPVGGSVLLALGYRLAGEPGLYVVNPVSSLLLLVAVGWFAYELFRDDWSWIWIAAFSIAIMATSHTLFDWATVPMVDAQAALASALAFGCALQFRRGSRWGWAFLAGVALGAAYFVRHTQLMLAPALAVLMWFSPGDRGARVRGLVAAAVAALFVSIPDLWYHQAVFGGVLNVESAELSLYSLGSVGTTLGTTMAGLAAANEFGWLIPFVLYGGYRLARNKPAESASLVLWLAAVLAVQLPYPALRLRDLLPEFAPIVIAAAFGMVAFVEWLWRKSGAAGSLAASVGLLATMFLTLIRVWILLPQAWSLPQPSFGYVTRAQRAAFDQLAELTPADSVIGASLDTGPIELYAHRETCQPALWNSRERSLFVEAMFRAGRPVYLLDDSAETSRAREELSAEYGVREVASLNVPIFSQVDGPPGALYQIVSR